MSNNVPNIDAMSPNEAQTFANRVKANVFSVRDEIFPDKSDTQLAATVQLGAYAQARAEAGNFRLSGNIPAALRAEAFMDNIYARLPIWARW